MDNIYKNIAREYDIMDSFRWIEKNLSLDDDHPINRFLNLLMDGSRIQDAITSTEIFRGSNGRLQCGLMPLGITTWRNRNKIPNVMTIPKTTPKGDLTHNQTYYQEMLIRMSIFDGIVRIPYYAPVDENTQTRMVRLGIVYRAIMRNETNVGIPDEQ